MSTEFEDPRKTTLRTRCEAAVDAAGYSVLPDRPAVPWPSDSGLEGALLGDVVSEDGDGNRYVHFVRVEGSRPLPEWLARATEASFAIPEVRIYAVAEDPSDVLTATCRAAGIGLARLTTTNRLEIVLEYGPPDQSEQSRRFKAKLREVGRKLDTKYQLNSNNLKQSFRDSDVVTSEMDAATRDKYLDEIEKLMVGWREWVEELSERLNALAAEEDEEELKRVEVEVLKGPSL